MRYKDLNLKIKHDQRAQINDRALYVVHSGNTDFTKEEIFNLYTGQGNLHGLNFKDYKSFHEYSEEKRNIEGGEFFTPINTCENIIDTLSIQPYESVADLTCGIGNFFNHIPEGIKIYGNDISARSITVAKYLYPDAELTSQDIACIKLKYKLDVIVGNPPYALQNRVQDKWYDSELYYFIKSHELLQEGGLLAVLVPMSFMKDSFTNKSDIECVNEMYDFIGQVKLPANTFKRLGVNYYETKVMFFRKKSKFLTGVVSDGENNLYNSSLFSEFNVIKACICKAREEKESAKNLILLESKKEIDEDVVFDQQIKKYLYDIKVGKNTAKYYSYCQELVNKYYTQEKPEDLSTASWELSKIKKEDVIKTFKHIFKNQHFTELETWNADGKSGIIKYTTGVDLKNLGEVEELSSYRDLIKSYLPGADQFELHHKWLNFRKQDVPFDEIPVNYISNEYKYLETVRVCNEFPLTEIQKRDIYRVLKKDYGILNWSMGAGKTIAGISVCEYRYKTYRTGSIIVSTALAINNTWTKALAGQGLSYKIVKSVKDLEEIPVNTYLLFTFDSVNKLSKYIKKFLKINKYKVQFVLDEADEICNYETVQTASILKTFKKCKYKLLTTGTTLRNNLAELYPLLELLLNRSINMDCDDCQFRPYKKGLSDFKSMFNPEKTTIFGVKKQDQGIKNETILAELIKKVVITRTTDEMLGKDKYKIHTLFVEQNEPEKKLYKLLIENLEVIYNYYTKNENARRENLMKIIKQIKLLIKACSTPQAFSEYASRVQPSKQKEIMKLINKFSNEKVAIGVTSLKALETYEGLLRPTGRQIFVVEGSSSFEKRNEIVQEFDATENGILICTQQSLKSSVNIPRCNKVIVEALQWNLPVMSQFYFRFIRFDSKDKKDVYFVMAKDSIEINIFLLLMEKLKITNFIETLEIEERTELMNRFNVTGNIIDMILKRTEKVRESA